jgi:asparagine synthase (glutamine-hydrolysing)
MCGIVGVLAAAPVDERLVEAMRDRLVHRGPDAAGLWRSDDGRTCLGHRRLAIIDLSPEANQPFVSADGRYVLTYNGEIYNFRELREELEELGATFRTSSDTEVLVQAFAAWGEGCLERLSGMFAFAVWDERERRLLCARDRAGEKPFHYALANGSFVFASELKSLLLHPGFRREIDYRALVDYFSFGFVPDPRTIWAGARKLEPGHVLWVDLTPAGPRPGNPRQYWDLTFEPDASVEDWRPRVLETLERVAPEMATADVAVGAFLSGGVDSSAVTAALGRAEQRISTFTIGFEELEFDEREWARTVSGLYGTSHTERVVRPEDFGAVFPDTILTHYDEPFNDHSYVPTLFVCRAARESITVALSGDGGDELFCGYSRYGHLAARESLQPARPPQGPLSKPASSVRRLSAAARGRRLGRWWRRDATDLLVDLVTPCLDEPTLRSVARGELARVLDDYGPRDTVKSLVRKAPPAEVGLLNAMRYLDFKLTLGGGILVKIDRASMAVSLEVRPVFLHRDFLALAGRIPPELLASHGTPKRLLKSALEPWLPRGLLYREKTGFTMPLSPWLRNELQALLPSVRGRDGPLGELLSADFVERVTREHLAGNDDWVAVLHSLLFLDRWLERWA